MSRTTISTRPTKGKSSRSTSQAKGGAGKSGGGCRCARSCSCDGGTKKQSMEKLANHNYWSASPSRTVSSPTDQHERQAEQIADAVVARTIGGGSSSGQDGEAEQEETESGARSGSNQARIESGLSSGVKSALASSGRALDDGTRQYMESRLGYDFSDVRIHSGSAAAAAARSMQARAFTVGNRVVLGANARTDSGSAGRRLLAHELVHVVQQTGRAPRRGSGGTRSQSGAGGALNWRPLGAPPIIQRDLAIEPPNPDADGRVLTPEEIQDAIQFNERVLGSVPDSAAVIAEVRDVLGTSEQPAVIDQDFVEAVVDWQAMQGVTQDGKLGPTSARSLFREFGAEGVGRCEVTTSPRYRPGGTLSPPAVGGAQQTTFRFNAEFASRPADGVYPSCCEVRQLIRWDAAAAASFGGGRTVPHGGFPAGTGANTWIEDRDAANNRYGRRSGPSSDPQAFDQYLDSSGRRNQAFGHRYRGSDTPGGPDTLAGQWRFLVRVVDVCNGNRRVGSQSSLRINW